MFKPTKIYIDARSKTHKLTKTILQKYRNVPIEVIKHPKAFIKSANSAPEALFHGKKVLFLTVNKGRFFKPCPGTKNYICCGYKILNLSTQCNIDCSYCILQAYFNNPLITVFTNTRDLFAELNSVIDADPSRLLRIGTGEFTDSLALDHITDFSTTLIPFFIKKKNAMLELKTKTTNIAHLLRFDSQGKIIISWSLNTKRIIENEEHGAASLEKRLAAAQICQKHGYKVGFHFDPILYYANWEKEYQQTIDALFSHVSGDQIAWISLGCFRFMPGLKSIIQQRFPKSTLIYNEFIVGHDKKLRYPKPVRIHMYKRITEMIRKHNSNVFIYLCMESRQVWKQALGYTPDRFGTLRRALDARVFQ